MDGVKFEWRRGFIEATSCPAEFWLANADSIVSQHPVREVRLTTWPHMELEKQGHPWWYAADREWRRLITLTGWSAIMFHLPEADLRIRRPEPGEAEAAFASIHASS